MDQVIELRHREVIHPWIFLGIPTRKRKSLDECWQSMVEFIEKRYQTRWEYVTAKNRFKGLVYLRQLACYWFYNEYKTSYDKVTVKWLGKKFGGQNHTTMVHSIQTFQDLLDTNSLVPDHRVLGKRYTFKFMEKHRVTFPEICGTNEDYEQFKYQIKLWL